MNEEKLEPFEGFSETESAEIRDTIDNYLDPDYRKYARCYFSGQDAPGHIAVGFLDAWLEAGRKKRNCALGNTTDTDET